MSVWDWIGEFERNAVENNDRERLRLMRGYHEGYALRERDPDAAFAFFSDSRQQALTLNEPWLALFFDEWRITALLHFKRDYRTVLELAVASALEARKPQYAQYPGRQGIFDNLISAYIGIDPPGHAEAIVQALEFLDKEIPDEPDSHRYLLQARNRIFAQELEQYPVAREWALRELALADRDHDRQRAEHFRCFVYCSLCTIAYFQEDWDALAGWAEEGDAVTRRVGHQVELSELLAWRAVVAQRAGEAEKALRLARSALARMKGQKMPPSRGFYEGLCALHALNGYFEAEMSVRDRELRDVSGWGRFWSEARCRRDRIRLLIRMGVPFEAEKAAALEVAKSLKVPGPYLEEIERITKKT